MKMTPSRIPTTVEECEIRIEEIRSTMNGLEEMDNVAVHQYKQALRKEMKSIMKLGKLLREGKIMNVKA